MKTKVKVPAKINLSLSVFEKENGYHNLQSVFASIDIYDEITLSKRNDNLITLKEMGIKSGVSEKENNAYKVAEYLVNEYKTCGVDIVINKKIPVGAGLGGSSCDIVGVIKCFSKLFNGINLNENEIADKFGSDCKYMLNGGIALVEGRGDKITPIKTDKTFYLIISLNGEISTEKCFNKFDELNDEPSNSKKCAEYLGSGKIKEFFNTAKNDLYKSAVLLLPSIKDSYENLSAYSPLTVMTGSGSAVLGVFESEKERDIAFEKVSGKKIKAKTI